MPIKLQVAADRKVDKAFLSGRSRRSRPPASLNSRRSTSRRLGRPTPIGGYKQIRSARGRRPRRRSQASNPEWGSHFDTNLASGKRAAASLGLDGEALDALDRSIGSAATMDLLARSAPRSSATPLQEEPRSLSPIPRMLAPRSPGSPETKRFRTLCATPRTRRRGRRPCRWQDLHAAAYPTAEPSAPEPPATPPSGPTDDSRAAARLKIDDHLANAGFMGSLRDKAHADHAANRPTLTKLHTEAGITRDR